MLITKYTSINTLVVLIVSAGIGFSCTMPLSDNDPELEPTSILPTKILRVDRAPDTAKTGESVTFTCIIADSADDEFQYQWQIERQIDTVSQVTDKNQVTISAPDSIEGDTVSIYPGNVTVFKKKGNNPVPHKRFTYPVKAQ